MIKLNGLNKILKISLLVGVLLGVIVFLMVKFLLSDEDLLKWVKLYNIKEDMLISCNVKVDGF